MSYSFCPHKSFRKALLKIFAAIVGFFFLLSIILGTLYEEKTLVHSKLPKADKVGSERISKQNYGHHIEPSGFPLPDSLKSPAPELVFGEASKNADIIIGITSVKRENGNYVIDTIKSLIENMGSADVKLLFVVYFGESDADFVRHKSMEIFRIFSNKGLSHLLQVVSPPKTYYPDWTKVLERNFGDDFERVKWRSKQNLDEIWLMMYAYSLSPTYYLMLEDDVIASKSYINRIFLEIQRPRQTKWAILSFCELGAIGKLFRSEELPAYASFLHTFWNKKPLDWLLSDYVRTAYCNPEKSCNALLNVRYVRIHPSLFQHVGKFSSLKGKIQKLRDGRFRN